MALATVDLVHDLTDNTFRSFVAENDMVLVGFVLPFLPKYQRFSREFEEAARAACDFGVQFAKVNCQTETKVCGEFEFGRWPTVKLFRGSGNVKLYNGAWKASDIVSYLARQSLPTISVITADSLQDLKTTSNVIIVGYFAHDDKISDEAFTSVAEALHEDYVFGITNDDALAKSERINVPGIASYKSFGDGKNVFRRTHDGQAIADFVKFEGTPSVVEFHPELYFSYVNTELPLGHIVAETLEEQARLLKMVEPLAKEYKDKILFGTVDIKSFDALADILHFEPDDWPTFAIKEPVKGHRYLLMQRHQLSEEVLGIFVRDFIEGKLKPTIKSEPVPEAQQGPVVVVVGNSYENLVINNEKDVLLDYYTQSCVPCKAMAPTYERLAKLYASNATGCNRVTIAKIDAEANDVPSDIRGFPTFKLYPAGRKESPVRYDGPWTIEGLANFVRDNGKHGVDVLLEDNATESKILQVEHPVAQTTCGKAVSGTDAYKTGAVQGAASKEDEAPPIVLAEIRESARSDHGEL